MWVDYKPVDVDIDDDNTGIIIYLHIYGLIINPHNDLLVRAIGEACCPARFAFQGAC